MIGFIKRDIAMIKSNFKLLGLLIVIYIGMGLIGEMDISFILPFMSVMIMITTFSYDNFNKWDAYSITLPNGRRNSVKSKYITTIIMILCTSIVTLILSLLIAMIHSQTINYEQVLMSLLGSIFGTLLVLTVMYPIIYKFGVEKARIGIFIIVFGIVVIGGIVLQYFDFSAFGKLITAIEDYLVAIIVIIMIAMVYISYIISKNIFLKKEF